MMGFGLFFEFSFEFSQLLRIIVSQINALRIVLIQVVKLPGVFIKRLCALQISRDKAAWVRQFGFPAVVVNRSRAEDVVILCVFGKPALSRILGLFPGGFAATTSG
jgi:hypothetical protein